MPKLVIIESPYAGDIERNVAYARAAMAHSLSLGEAPFASHLLYTQPGILDDADYKQRVQGITAGFAWGKMASRVAVYNDLGLSRGMENAICYYQGMCLPPEIVYRSLVGTEWWSDGWR